MEDVAAEAKKVGRILILNTITSTDNLQGNLVCGQWLPKEDTRTLFPDLTDAELYSRLLSDINLSTLSGKEKDEFLLIDSNLSRVFPQETFYKTRMRNFIQEAHNRTCSSLGIKPAKMVFCQFDGSKGMDPQEFSSFDVANGKIYINSGADYLNARPSILLENVNARTYQHFIFQNIASSIKAPDKLSDKDFYIAVETAVKNHVYQEHSNPNSQGNFLLNEDDHTAGSIQSQIFAFEKTRQDLQSAGLYGDRVRNELRRSEINYHTALQKYLGNESLLNTENIFAYYRQAEINASSGGLMGELLDKIDGLFASSFYNSIGATMTPGTSVEQYLDILQGSTFSRNDFITPTLEELEALSSSDNFLLGMSLEQVSALTSYNQDELSDEAEESVLSDESEYFAYKPFEDVLMPEGSIYFNIKLPFHNFNLSQDTPIEQ